jgi:hypothetical protein
MRMGGATLARACGLLALAAALSVGSADARPDQVQQAGPSVDAQDRAGPLAERARSVLQAYCDECREEGGDPGAILDLDALAENPRFVVPRRPDASRIYQRLFVPPIAPTPEAGKAVDAKGVAATASPSPPRPTPAEIETVRDWIDSLPARDAACRDRTIVTPDAAEALIDRWAKLVGVKEAADTRFLSLVHLWNACVPAERLEALREATITLVTALSRRNQPLEIETLGEESAILAFRLSQFDRPPDEKEALVEQAPNFGGVEVIPADWLAAEALSEADALHLVFDGATQRSIASLARAWTGDVDLVRAAAERGATPRDLARQLAKLEGDLVYPARKLTHGTLSRAMWNELSRVLDGRFDAEKIKALAVPSSSQNAESEIDVLLWSDQPAYWPRDLVTLKVRVDRACHLTLINVDRDGKALVLFPNELEPHNLIAPGVVVAVPGHNAGYQLRFDRSGEEQFVAICQRREKQPEGIGYDYERQRFAALGDWRAFLRAAPDKEKAIAAREAAEANRRKRRGRKPADPDPPAIEADGPEIEGRAAISITIDPGRM